MNALRENKLSDKLLQARIIVTAGKEDKYRQSMIQQVPLIRIRVLEVIWMEISWWVKQPARIVSKIYSPNLSYLNFLKEIAEKKRLDRAARLDRRKQIQRGEIIQDSQINSGAGGPDQTFLSSSHLGGAGGSKSYQKHKQMEMHEQMPGRSAGYASGEEGADEYK